MEFSEILYRCPGAHQCPGGTFSYVGAYNQAEFDQYIADGWHSTMPEAMAKKASPVAPQLVTFSDEKEDDNSPPNRDELKLKAQELGIAVDGRWSDKKLGDLIASALEK